LASQKSKSPSPSQKPNGNSSPKHRRAPLSADKAKEFRMRMESGESPAAIAEDEGLPYMTVYRLGTGGSYRKLGPALVERSTKVKITPERRAWIVDVKKRKNWTNVRIAEKLQVTSATVARVLLEERLVLAARVQAMFLSSGSNAAARKKFGLNPIEVESLIELAAERPIPEKLKDRLEE
jgi:hypothetical protein